MDPEAFRRFEHDGWQRVAGSYEGVWAPLTSQFVGRLLTAVQVGIGTRLLDMACGPGYVSAAARGVGALPVGVDFSAAMVARARALHPGIEFREGDAEQLEFPSGGFDAVAMNFGILHLARPERAVAEARRVLAPAGRFGFTVWASTDRNPGRRIMTEAIEAYGDATLTSPEGPAADRFANPDECRRALSVAGFSAPTMEFETVEVQWLVPTARFLFDAERYAGVRTAALLARQSEQRQAAIRAAVEQRVEPYSTGAGYAIPMTAHIVSAEALGTS